MEAKKQKAKEAGELYKSPQKRSKYDCGRCGQPKNKEHGHMLYNRAWFCPITETRPYDEWLAEQKRALAEKSKSKFF